MLFLPNRAFGQNATNEVDLLIKNTTIADVLTKQPVYNRNIAIKNGLITAISDTNISYKAKVTIDGSNLLALPGFIDTHTHIWQHICKSCYPKENLQTWVRVYNAIYYLDENQLYDVVLAASDEALLSGITTVSDYASLSFSDYGFDVNARAMRDAGLDGVLVYNNPSFFLPDSIKLKEIPLLNRKYADRFNIWMGYGPLSFYSIPQVYSGIVIAHQLNMNVTEHTMENNKEQRDFYDSTKIYFNRYHDRLQPNDQGVLQQLLSLKRPSDVDAYAQALRTNRLMLETDSALIAQRNKLYKPLTSQEKASLQSMTESRLISPLILLDYLGGLKGFLAIHSVWPQKEDIEIMKRNNISVSHNPESNLYLSSGIAPISNYRDANVLVSLGTDGAASNDGINMFSAMKEMWNMYKIRALNIEASKNIDAWDILQSATINGAKALKIDDKTGSLNIDKYANITLVASDQLGMSPIRWDKVISLLIYSGNARNVKYVICRGNIRVRNGQLTQSNESHLANSLTAIAADVDLKIKNGKSWVGTFEMDDNSLKDYWYKYSAIRKADTVNLTLINKQSSPIKISVLSSGLVFGGGSPDVASPEVNKRFPKDAPSTAFKEQYWLKPKESIQIVKARNGYKYQITTSSGTKPENTSSGQLLLLAERR
jgi:cytosine/adenosine deaminase-related metal-dependent hydrolase